MVDQLFGMLAPLKLGSLLFPGHLAAAVAGLELC